MRAIRQFTRNFDKQRVVGVLNICSLSLGIMVSTVIGLWVINELSFDNFHPDGDRIYRMIVKARVNDAETSGALSHEWMGEMSEDRLPEVEQAVWMTFAGAFGDETEVVIDDVSYAEVDYIVASPDLFDFFNFPLAQGDPATAFAEESGHVIVSESAATKYFGNRDPMGQAVTIDGDIFTVGGIMRDAPSNSHLQPEMVFPIAGSRWENWDGDMYTTYVRLTPGADAAATSKAVTTLLHERMPFYKDFGARIELEPLRDIHFSANSLYDPAVKGNRKTLRTFSLIAAIILVISCINFMNLFVSTSFLRARSIGVKKTMGGSRLSLMLDFYGETSVYVVVSLAIGMFLASAGMPLFNSLVHTNIAIDFASPQIYLFAAALTVTVTLLAGSFPALYMTRFGIIETLRGKFKGRGMSALQKGLLILQFSAATFLMIVVMFFGRQIDHMLSVDLGFDMQNVIYTKARAGFGSDNYASLREELMREPSIVDVTLRHNTPLEWAGGMPVRRNSEEEDIMTERVGVKPNYFDFMGMEIISGENPFRDNAPDSRNVVINESAAKILGWDDPLGHEIFSSFFDGGMMISGVVRNALTRSLRTDMEPQVYVNMPYGNGWEYLYFKVSGDPRRAIAAIEQQWDITATDGEPFRYEFLDQSHATLYRSETDSRNVLAYALMVTLVITVAGLFAMSYFSMQRRVKEIGIRKINGATIADLMLLLNRDMVVWVGISFVAGAGAGWLFLRDWLEGFVMRTPLSVWVFLLAGAGMCFVALATVSTLTWRAATANPVKSLKSE
ncbi:MAG: ABC transporter permease [Alistipes sp.]|jgi:putative ABC transport system permease protein|nr:ABC transporter permease [Alistipes sp.]